MADTDDRAVWIDAVELGAQGRVAAARTRLLPLMNGQGTSLAVRSLAHSTRASLVRQAGAHALARTGDGRACALAAAAATDGGDEWLAAAWVDGLVGLAADNLGIGDFAQSRRLLDRAADFLAGRRLRGAAATTWQTIDRVELRCAWVRAEWGLYSGDLATARAASSSAGRLAEELPSARHRIKTKLISAAVAAADGQLDAANQGAREAFDGAAAEGLVPLQWAAASLLSGVSPDAGAWADEVARQRVNLAQRGMTMMPLAMGERISR